MSSTEEQARRMLEEDRVEECQRLVKEDADALRAERDGPTVLGHAYVLKKWSFVQWLLDHGANPNVYVPGTKTRLVSDAIDLCRFESVRCQMAVVVERLTDAGAVPTREDMYKWGSLETDFCWNPNAFCWECYTDECERWDRVRGSFRKYRVPSGESA